MEYYSGEALLHTTNVILFCILLCVIVMAKLLFKYVKIFNDIYQNTEELKKNVKKLNRAISTREQEALLKALD